MLYIRVFTHPVCKTCPAAIGLAEAAAAAYPDVAVLVISLGSPQGRAAAKAEGILSVPTIIVGDIRFVGVPERDALVKAIERERHKTHSTR